MSRKSSTLVIATRQAGRCADCRHANQGTADFTEGKAFCWIAKQPKRRDQKCDVEMPLPRRIGGPSRDYFMYERFDRMNGTFDHTEDLRILAEDAEPELRQSLAADRSFIPAES